MQIVKSDLRLDYVVDMFNFSILSNRLFIYFYSKQKLDSNSVYSKFTFTITFGTNIDENDFTFEL